jgi:uncharacterized protein YndB with AHSA1/START domain
MPDEGLIVRQVGGDASLLQLEADITGIGPDGLFRFWTEPERITRWWPQEAEIEPRMGGAYHLAWPGPGFHLRGRYIHFEPGVRLAFGWKWDESGETAPERHVDIRFQPYEDGTRISLTHGLYADSDEDREERQHHVEGWQYFLPRLASAVKEEA